jgi:hypothetical protein
MGFQAPKILVYGPSRGNSTKREMRNAKSAQDPDRQIQTISVGSGDHKTKRCISFALFLLLACLLLLTD